MTSKKLSQFPNLVQVGSPTSPGFAGMITAFAGSAIPNGWALCNGSTLDKTTYSQLFARIGATWDVGTNPLTGVAYSAPGGNLFRLPDLRGVFLRNVGDYAGADAYNTANDVALGAYKPDQFQGHYHDSGISIRALNNSAAGNYYLASQSSALDIGTVRPGQYEASSNGTNGTPRTGFETAPKQVGVNYLIKLYDDAGAIVMSGSPFVGSNFSEDYATQIDNFTAEINKAYTVNKATAVAVTLPAATIGAVINFKNIGVGIATITKAGSDTIDGATSIALAQYQAIKLKCFAANLWGVY